MADKFVLKILWGEATVVVVCGLCSLNMSANLMRIKQETACVIFHFQNKKTYISYYKRTCWLLVRLPCEWCVCHCVETDEVRVPLSVCVCVACGVEWLARCLQQSWPLPNAHEHRSAELVMADLCLPSTWVMDGPPLSLKISVPLGVMSSRVRAHSFGKGASWRGLCRARLYPRATKSSTFMSAPPEPFAAGIVVGQYHSVVRLYGAAKM